MSKLRQPPIFQFEGLSFLVDIDKQVLCQTNNGSHEISFITQMIDRGDHYILPFDLIRKRVADNIFAHDQVEPIVVPPLVKLDPEGMSEKYGVPIDQLAGKTDFEVIVNQEALLQRENGVLPRINIAGQDFTIDLRLQELRHTEFFFPVLSLKSFDLTDDGGHYVAFYEPIMKQVVNIDPKLTEFPDGIIRIKLPNEIGLDPLGTAQKYGMNERELLRRHPIQKELKAEVIPLSETNIPALIQRNREALRQEHRENMQRMKPRVRPEI
jgi:hypothetical protein